MNNTSDLSLRLKKARQKKGLSQNAAADKLNVSRQAVSRWETGKNSPDINILPLISELYEISLDELLGHDTPPENNLTNITKEGSNSDEASPNKYAIDETALTPDPVSSHTKNSFNWEHGFLILLLVMSSFTAFTGFIVSLFIFIWTWKNRPHYKWILIIAVICFIIQH